MAHIMIALALSVALAFSGAAPAGKVQGPKKTALKIEVKPDAAVVYVDGKVRGKGGKAHLVVVEPGTHLIKVVHKKDEHQEMVRVKPGETKSWVWEFEDDRPKPRGKSDESSPDEAPADENGGDEATE